MKIEVIINKKDLSRERLELGIGVLRIRLEEEYGIRRDHPIYEVIRGLEQGDIYSWYVGRLGHNFKFLLSGK